MWQSGCAREGAGARLGSRSCFPLLCIPGLPRGLWDLDHAVGLDCSVSYREIVPAVGAEPAAEQVICVFFLLSSGTRTAVGQSPVQHGACSVLAAHSSIKDPPSSASPIFPPFFHDLAATFPICSCNHPLRAEWGPFAGQSLAAGPALAQTLRCGSRRAPALLLLLPGGSWAEERT